MEVKCQKSCTEWRDEIMRYRSVEFDDEGEFYNLESKTAQGETIHYDKFEGYVSTCTQVLLICFQKITMEKGSILGF